MLPWILFISRNDLAISAISTRDGSLSCMKPYPGLYSLLLLLAMRHRTWKPPLPDFALNCDIRNPRPGSRRPRFFTCFATALLVNEGLRLESPRKLRGRATNAISTTRDDSNGASLQYRCESLLIYQNFSLRKWRRIIGLQIMEWAVEDKLCRTTTFLPEKSRRTCVDSSLFS
jgi:hypothetical protein